MGLGAWLGLRVELLAFRAAVFRVLAAMVRPFGCCRRDWRSRAERQGPKTAWPRYPSGCEEWRAGSARAGPADLRERRTPGAKATGRGQPLKTAWPRYPSGDR